MAHVGLETAPQDTSLPAPSYLYDLAPRKVAARTRQVVIRRPGREQGLALEALGHAVEYLIDSRMAQIETPHSRAEQDALQILMGLSRSVFESCPQILPLRQRATIWFKTAFQA